MNFTANGITQYDLTRQTNCKRYFVTTPKTRPADTTRTVGGKSISQSVYERRKYGQGQKRNDFYQSRIQIDDAQLTFTDDFEELSSDPGRGVLDKKIAVIYLDGNKFGDFQHKHCRNESTQACFDQSIRGGQNIILNDLIQLALDNTGGLWRTNDGKIRLETLLWGGDEIIWVVPAWLGFEALDLFYQRAATEINFVEEQPVNIGKKRRKKKRKKDKSQDETVEVTHILNHAAGLVFCNHKTPIHRVVGLVKDLADLAKKKSKDNLIAYQILESFDHAGTDLKRWRKTRSHLLGSNDDLFLDPANIRPINENIKQLQQSNPSGFPKRKIYQIIKALKDGDHDRADRLCKKISCEHREILEQKLRPLFGCSDVMWLHLVDLWDYMGELS